mmetsp:Transcript_42846/g.126946  ORF Transcript_42846/g.126946 Transcript_42846/m.126946 type:complete len:125 (+) Transcript_42846:220-594(+)
MPGVPTVVLMNAGEVWPLMTRWWAVMTLDSLLRALLPVLDSAGPRMGPTGWKVSSRDLPYMVVLPVEEGSRVTPDVFPDAMRSPHLPGASEPECVAAAEAWLAWDLRGLMPVARSPTSSCIPRM